MPGTFQGNKSGPSYTQAKLTNMKGQNKRETDAFADTASTSETIRGANKRTVTKESRNTGRVK